MKKDFDYFDNAPMGFGLCFKAECASASDCLRSFAAYDVKKTRPQLLTINPLLADTEGAQACPFFRRVEWVRVTYGFSGVLAQVSARRVRGVRSAICELACQRNYYHLLRGEKAMMPKSRTKWPPSSPGAVPRHPWSSTATTGSDRVFTSPVQNLAQGLQMHGAACGQGQKTSHHTKDGLTTSL